MISSNKEVLNFMVPISRHTLVQFASNDTTVGALADDADRQYTRSREFFQFNFQLR